MKFIKYASITAITLSFALLIVTQWTPVKPDFWTWAQVIASSLIIGYVFKGEKK